MRFMFCICTLHLNIYSLCMVLVWINYSIDFNAQFATAYMCLARLHGVIQSIIVYVWNNKSFRANKMSEHVFYAATIDNVCSSSSNISKHNNCHGISIGFAFSNNDLPCCKQLHTLIYAHLAFPPITNVVVIEWKQQNTNYENFCRLFHLMWLFWWFFSFSDSTGISVCFYYWSQTLSFFQ